MQTTHSDFVGVSCSLGHLQGAAWYLGDGAVPLPNALGSRPDRAEGCGPRLRLSSWRGVPTAAEGREIAGALVLQRAEQSVNTACRGQRDSREQCWAIYRGYSACQLPSFRPLVKRGPACLLCFWQAFTDAFAWST